METKKKSLLSKIQPSDDIRCVPLNSYQNLMSISKQSEEAVYLFL